MNILASGRRSQSATSTSELYRSSTNSTPSLRRNAFQPKNWSLPEKCFRISRRLATTGQPCLEHTCQANIPCSTSPLSSMKVLNSPRVASTNPHRHTRSSETWLAICLHLTRWRRMSALRLSSSTRPQLARSRTSPRLFLYRQSFKSPRPQPSRPPVSPTPGTLVTWRDHLKSRIKALLLPRKLPE